MSEKMKVAKLDGWWHVHCYHGTRCAWSASFPTWDQAGRYVFNIIRARRAS